MARKLRLGLAKITVREITRVGESDHNLRPLIYENMVKSVQNEKYSAKSADFLRFLLYLCHVIDDFACLDLQH